MDYQWYAKINDNSLEQGDIISDCYIIVPPSSESLSEGDDIDVDVKTMDIIILSQSCDLVCGREKIDIVLVCPIYDLIEFGENQSPPLMSKKLREKAENIRKGKEPGYHLLDKDESNSVNDYKIVDFRNVYGVDINFLRSLSTQQKDRIRLLPPYREHLSQAFARLFMRVGLPNDIKLDIL